MEQSAKLMQPAQAGKEEDIAEAIELWEEKMNRLAQHGEEFRLSDTYKKVALKRILLGKTRDNFETWQTEKLPFEELLRKTKELARSKKLDTDAARGKAAVTLGKKEKDKEKNKPEWRQGEFQAEEEVNAMAGGKGQPKGGKSKGKGKGKYGQAKGTGKGSMATKGCFICGGSHFARECPSNPMRTSAVNASGSPPCSPTSPGLPAECTPASGRTA